MSTNTTTTTTESSAKGRRCVQGNGDNKGGVSGSTTAPVDWQQQRSVDFPFYCVSNSIPSSLCLVAVLFGYCFRQIPFFCSLQEMLSVLQSCRKYFLPSVHEPCVCTPYVQESKKLRVLMINKQVRKSLVYKNGNEMIIWIWNKPRMLRENWSFKFVRKQIKNLSI